MKSGILVIDQYGAYWMDEIRERALSEKSDAIRRQSVMELLGLSAIKQITTLSKQTVASRRMRRCLKVAHV